MKLFAVGLKLVNDIELGNMFSVLILNLKINFLKFEFMLI